MADGSFPTLVSKDTTANGAANPIYVQLSDGTNALDTANGGVEVVVNNTVPVSASDLDIRPIQAGDAVTEDNILIFANTVKDGTGTNYVPLVDGDGQLQVDVLTMPAVSIDYSYTDDGNTFAITTGKAGLIAGYANMSAPDSVDEGDTGAVRMTLDRQLLVQESNSASIKTAVEIMDDWDDSNYCNVNLNLAGTDVTGGAGAVGAGTPRVTLASDDPAVVALQIMDDWDNGSDQANIDIAACSTYVTVSKNSSVNSETNPIYVSNVAGAVSGNEVHDYATSTGTGNNDYTVAGTTFLLKSVIFAASGGMKATIQAGPLASLATVAVGFIPHQGGTEQLFFDPPVEVPVASTGTVRVIMTNREGTSMDVYSTIIGNDIA